MAARHSIVTVAGRNKEAAQKAANLPVRFTEIALGSGDRYPAGGETTLQAEVHRGQITGSGVMAGEPNAVWFDLYVAADVATFYTQEIGLFDEDGVLYALSRFDQPVPKFGPDSASLSDNTFRIVVVFSDTENVVVETSPVAGITADTLSQHLPWATDTEAADAAKEKRVIDPKRLWGVLGDLAGSENKAGLLSLANISETKSGEISDKAVHPAGLAAALNGSLERIVTYTEPGTYTFVVPEAVTSVLVEVWGAGGGGGASGDGSGGGVEGNAGGGGSAGGYSRKLVGGLNSGEEIPVVVGAGSISAASADAVAGGSSSFGAYCSATGGGGGKWGANTLNFTPPGGVGVGGDLNLQGGSGGPTDDNSFSYNPSASLIVFSKGGLPPMGTGTVSWSGTGQAGLGFATGGNGASGGSNALGGQGAPGLVIVRW